jgi:hypothetical protein
VFSCGDLGKFWVIRIYALLRGKFVSFRFLTYFLKVVLLPNETDGRASEVFDVIINVNMESPIIRLIRAV